ncbi:hypothetical protein VP01_1740g3 [Puccinia sorghi]|uniref:Wax synthase domain-containing protein n=1 Tax=Puccinia sorghi TaxID=27349 RepID=A0A0L6VF43_9BASI|nr:hypothetical protein VP01_1740g3 [Puccinia sorghi]
MTCRKIIFQSRVRGQGTGIGMDKKLSPKIMTSISVSPALSVSYIWQLIVNYITVPVLLFQGALLHPYFEPDPQARKIRAWLAPVIIFLVTYSQKTRLFRPLEDYIHINYCVAAIPTFHIVCLALQYATHRGPARLIDEAKHKREPEPPASCSDTESDTSSSITNSDSHVTPTEVVKVIRRVPKTDSEKKTKAITKSKGSRPSIGELARFSIWMTSSPRSLGYVWGPPASVLVPAPKMTMTKFLMRLFMRIIFNQVALIFYLRQSSRHLAGPFSLRKGVHATLGKHRLARLRSRRKPPRHMGAALDYRRPASPSQFIILETRAIRHHPVPRPLLKPGWHCTFRRDFILCGAKPLAKLFSPLGLTASRMAGLLGAMLSSGVLMNVALRVFCMDSGLVSSTNKVDWSFRTTKFFLLCGLGIALEMVFKKITGRRVRGLLGWIWLWGWFSFWCEQYTDAWFDTGVGLSGMRGPHEVNQWPLAKFLVPLGPLSPDEVLFMISDAFGKASSVFTDTFAKASSVLAGR